MDVSGDFNALPGDLRALLASVGPVWASDIAGHAARMYDAFAPLLQAAPKVARITRDIAYGPHPRQVLDVYHPDEAAAEPRPALIFVHGGAFVKGDRRVNDEVYANVLHRFARAGVVGINMEYRLAPQAPFPGGSLDVALCTAWVRMNAQALGVDPARVFLMGHSAGGAHAASYAYDRRWQPEGVHGLAGLILVSGRVRADQAPDNPNAANVAAYYGSNPNALEDASAVNHVGPDSPPTLIAYGGYENPLLDVYALELGHRLGLAKRRAPPMVVLPEHNHSSIIAHINTGDDRLSRAVLDFIADPLARA